MTYQIEHRAKAVRLKPTCIQLQAYRDCKQASDVLQHAEHARRSETAGDRSREWRRGKRGVQWCVPQLHCACLTSYGFESVFGSVFTAVIKFELHLMKVFYIALLQNWLIVKHLFHYLYGDSTLYLYTHACWFYSIPGVPAVSACNSEFHW